MYVIFAYEYILLTNFGLNIPNIVVFCSCWPGVGISSFGDAYSEISGSSLVSRAVRVPAWFPPNSEIVGQMGTSGSLPPIKSMLEKFLEVSQKVENPVNSGHADLGMDPDTPHTTGMAGRVCGLVSSSSVSVCLSVDSIWVSGAWSPRDQKE